MTTKTVGTFAATIYVGRKHRDTGKLVPMSAARKVIQAYVDRVGLCVTVTPTEYIYSNGGEPGFAVGLINYPRFPSTKQRIRKAAMELAGHLKTACRQYKVSVVFPDKTVMLSTEAR